jgi:hypothetical protein
MLPRSVTLALAPLSAIVVWTDRDATIVARLRVRGK